jgi:calcium-dependent protein kinase
MGKCVSVHKKPTKKNIQLAKYTFSIDIKSVYEFLNFCGSGRYGTVTRAILINDPSKEFAIKKINKEIINDPEELRKEVNILCELHHPNIIKIYETYEDMNNFYIVMQYCSGGTLYNKIISMKYFNEIDAAVIIKQVIRAIRHLHSKNICHRDIKPENFLFASGQDNSKLKLIDFGLSQKKEKWFKGCMSDPVGTVCYMAPEVLNQKYDQKCDLWSIGVLMYVLLSGILPFNANSKELLFRRILNTEPTFNENIWNEISLEAKDLIKRLLIKNPEKRIDIEEAYNHPWFSLKFSEGEIKNIETILGYAKKEELQIQISNILINRLNYRQIKDIHDKVQKKYEESVDAKEFEELVGINLEIYERGILINPKKVLEATLWAKLHLNEEKIWKVFDSSDKLKIKKISFNQFKKVLETLEGKNKRDLAKFSGKISFTLNDVMELFNQGKDLNHK